MALFYMHGIAQALHAVAAKPPKPTSKKVKLTTRATPAMCRAKDKLYKRC
jgi:hypothetical protein